MEDLNVQLHTKPIGCSLGTPVFSHLIYADDLLLFAPVRDYKRYLIVATYTVVNTIFNLMPPNL